MTEGSASYPHDWLLSPKLVSTSPWEYFSKIWTATTGNKPTSFVFIPASTPMSTAKETTVVILSYYLMIIIGRKTMRRRPAFDLTSQCLMHNLVLSVLSGFLLMLFVEELAPRLWSRGMYHNICGPGGWTQRLVTLYYVNYLTKYFELLDTLFLVLKKKPLTFLHYYHHGTTIVISYTSLIGQPPVTWVPITLNLMVHVLMYWYYFQSSRGIRVWWKEWITRLQILRFLIDLGFVYFASYNVFAHLYFPWLPHSGPCAGTAFAASVACAILTSYLALFVSFYWITYRSSSTLKRTTGAEKVVADVKKSCSLEVGRFVARAA